MIGIFSSAFISTRSLAVSKNKLLYFLYSGAHCMPASCLIQLTKVVQCAIDTWSLNDLFAVVLQEV